MRQAWTDYPIVQLGDTKDILPPIRKVNVLSYDGNHSCHILVDSVEIEIDSAYLYRMHGRLGQVPSLSSKDLMFYTKVKYD